MNNFVSPTVALACLSSSSYPYTFTLSLLATLSVSHTHHLYFYHQFLLLSHLRLDSAVRYTYSSVFGLSHDCLFRSLQTFGQVPLVSGLLLFGFYRSFSSNCTEVRDPRPVPSRIDAPRRHTFIRSRETIELGIQKRPMAVALDDDHHESQ